MEGLCPRDGGFDYSTGLQPEHLWVAIWAQGPADNECPSVGPNRAGVSWLWSAEWLTEAELKPETSSSLLSVPRGGERGTPSQGTEPLGRPVGLGWLQPSGALGPRQRGLPAAKQMRG